MTFDDNRPASDQISEWVIDALAKSSGQRFTPDGLRVQGGEVPRGDPSTSPVP